MNSLLLRRRLLGGVQYMDVPSMFLHRVTGGSADVGSGQATIKAIKGKTIVWNQIHVSRTSSSIVKNGITYEKLSNGTIHVYGTATSSAVFSVTVDVIAGHKYLLLPKFSAPGGWGVFAEYTNDPKLPLQANSKGMIAQCSETKYVALTFTVWGGITVDITMSELLFDLTLMFGAGNEPSTVEEFESLFPNDYYPYNAGQLLSFNGTDIVTNGFNQFDGMIEEGYWDTTDGQKKGSGNWRRFVNPIRVFPNTQYYGNVSNPSSTMVMIFRDEYGHPISSVAKLYWNNVVFTTPANCADIVCYFNNTFAGDICINLSWSGYRNGQYEPYWKETKSLPSLAAFDVAYIGADGEQHTEGGLKSAGTAYDEQTFIAIAGGLKVKNTRRIGVVDLGNLTFSRTLLSNNVYLFVARVNSKAQADCLCSVYSYGGNTRGKISNNDKRIGISNEFYNLAIRDDAYTDAATFKAAMAGVLLFYELAEPIETEFQDERNLSYREDYYGTEMVVSDNVDADGNPISAPFSSDIQYPKRKSTMYPR